MEAYGQNYQQMEKFSKKVPEPRCGHSLFQTNQEIYVIGGFQYELNQSVSRNSQQLHGLYQLSLKSMIWTKIQGNQILNERNSFSCSPGLKNSVLIFGGKKNFKEVILKDFK